MRRGRDNDDVKSKRVKRAQQVEFQGRWFDVTGRYEIDTGEEKINIEPQHQVFVSSETLEPLQYMETLPATIPILAYRRFDREAAMDDEESGFIYLCEIELPMANLSMVTQL